MGVFECGCHVVSETPGIQATQVYADLGSCGFHYTRQNRTIEAHSEFVYEDALHILEALTDLTCNHGESPCLSISLRFALCNPELAMAVFVDKATRLAQLLKGYVLDDYGKRYESQDTAENDLLIKSLASDYSNRSRLLKERLQYPIAKRTVGDFSRDVIAIRKRRSLSPTEKAPNKPKDCREVTHANPDNGKS